MQKWTLPAASGTVWEGSRNIIRPKDELSTYRSPAEETWNATDLPVRSSVTTLSTDTPKKQYLGPESMPTFEEWALQQPLGRQMLEDPPEVVDRLYARYERYIGHMISVEGGSHTHKCVYNNEWRHDKLEAEEKAPARATSARPNERTWKYADIPKQPERMRQCHGDIPAWAPKDYSSRIWPEVSVSGRNTARPKSTQWAATERVDPVTNSQKSAAVGILLCVTLCTFKFAVSLICENSCSC
jgi:hypothetical protein